MSEKVRVRAAVVLIGGGTRPGPSPAPAQVERDEPVSLESQVLVHRDDDASQHDEVRLINEFLCPAVGTAR